MDSNYGDFGSNTIHRPLRKRRSNLYRRPPNESESPQEYLDSFSLSSTPSDHVSDAPSVGKEPSTPSLHLADPETERKNYDESEALEESTDLKSSVENNPAAASWKSRQMKDNRMSEQATGGDNSEPLGTASDGFGTGNKFNKVRLKVGGLTHTIHTRSSSGGSSIAGTFTAMSNSDAIHPPPKMNRQENYNLRDVDEKSGLRGVPWKDFSKTSFVFEKADSFGADIPEESAKKALKHDRSSKKKSTINKYSADVVYEEVVEEDDDDDEIRYLQKLKTSRIASYDYTEYEDGNRCKKLRKISRVMDRGIEDSSLGIEDYGSSRSTKESKKLKSARTSKDTDYMEEEESVSDCEVEQRNKKQQSVAEYSKEGTITTRRRRATLTSRENSPGLATKAIQFPDGLPPAPPRKPKEQLTEMEQQLKRAEAAQRRRIQNEKVARESEAEAIRKILGQESSRKRREEKIKKRQEELAQERNANAATVAPNAVRWVMGPSGTVVTFPDEIGLPSIFEPTSCSYPPPREKCAAPSCTNVYKYRDSKSKLPLCSLQCYKALHEKAPPLHAW